MPIYTFKDNETGELFDRFLTLSERETFEKENNCTQQLYKSNLVSGVGSITQGDEWKSILKIFKRNNPGSNININ